MRKSVIRVKVPIWAEFDWYNLDEGYSISLIRTKYYWYSLYKELKVSCHSCDNDYNINYTIDMLKQWRIR